MKIGILTFHYGSNYGGVLQCYALQQILAKCGHEVQVINYVPQQPIKDFLIVCRSCCSRGVRKGIKSFINYLRHSKKCKRTFRDFTDTYLNKSKLIRDLKTLNSLNYDAVVVGSDQVWNSSQHSSPIYFLDWVRPNCKRISYAACCGRNVVKDQYRDTLISELSKFDLITVRSSETFDFVTQLIGMKPQVVCDPTMLYPFDEFKSSIVEKYILAYILGGEINGGNYKVVKKIKKKHPDLKVLAIQLGDRCASDCKWADTVLYDVSPCEWVNLIYNSSFVFTDSFHGSVFAMKFRKPLLAYYTSPVTGTRFKDLGNTYSMQNIITDSKEADSILNLNKELAYMYDAIIDKNVLDSLNIIKSI